MRVRSRQRGQQGGYILGIVLAAMVVGLTLITALLGLSFATHASAIAQQRLAREARAADGALEVAVEQLRTSADPMAACGANPWLVTVPMQLSGNSSAPDEDVGVRCQPELAPANAAGGVTIVGDDYDGALTFDAPLSSSDGTLLHQGAGPLRFVGNVEAKNGAALDGTTLGSQVAGSYKQGSPGAGAGSGCGVLAPVDPPQPNRQLVDAQDGEPACDVASLAGMTIPPAPPVTPPPTAGTVPSDCVTPVGPGYFDPAAVAALNTLLATCDQVVFPPAAVGSPANVYWFDAGFSGELVFGRAGASYVFGDPLGAGTPERCDPGHDGQLTVVLGGGTGISHTAGALTICGGDGNSQALVETELADPQPSLEFVGASTVSPTGSPLSPDWWTSPEKANGPWSDPAHVDYCRVSAPCGYSTLNYTIRSAGVTSLDDLAVEFKIQEYPNAFPGNRQLWVTITSGATTCQDVTQFRGRVADGMGTHMALPDCLAKFPDGTSLDGANMSVQFRTWGASPSAGCVSITGSGCPWSADIGDMGLVVNQVPIAPTGASSDGSWNNPQNVLGDLSTYTWAEQCPNDVCDRSGGVTTTSLTVDFSGATTPLGDALPDDQNGRLLLALDAALPDDYVAAPDSTGTPSTDVLLDWGDGAGFQSCIAPGTYSRSRASSVNESVAPSSSQFFDLTDCVAGRPISDLADLTVELRIRPESETYVGGPNPVAQGLELPQYARARLLSSPGSVEARPNISLTVDESIGTEFHLTGSSYLPSSDLDVTWAGTAGANPLFAGSLVVGSIGSRGVGVAEIGVVCCGPDHPALLLRADTSPLDGDSSARGLARVRLQPDATGTVSAVVTDWQLCSGAGCDVDPVSPGPSP